MRKVLKSVLLLFCGVCLVGSMVYLGQEPVNAQSAYYKQWVKDYPDLEKASLATDVKKCKVCHGAKKKMRNAYGEAVGKALGAKKVKDTAKISEALKKAAEAKSGVEGKTFGDLLKAGKLPAAKS
ncbi:MAG: hypothetical protein N2C14_16645 [Planctomycetales bacterium]